MNEMAGRTPHFPYALIGLGPASRGSVDQMDQKFPVVVVGGLPLGVPDPGQAQQLSVDIQLGLAFGGVSYAHGPGIPITLRAFQVVLDKMVLAADPKQNLNLVDAAGRGPLHEPTKTVGLFVIAQLREGSYGEIRIPDP
jgi:hypothetical protein